MPDLPLLLDVLVVWALLLMVVVLVLVRLRPRDKGRFSGDRRSGADRRAERGDRRVGMPDTRSVRVERRRGPQDRRGMSDRRGSPAAV